MNTAEHMILAKPDVWCSRGSPGGGTYGVLISNNFARAISASLSGLRRCDQIVAVARVTANKKTSGLLIFVSRGLRIEGASTISESTVASVLARSSKPLYIKAT